MAKGLPYFKWYPADAEMDEEYAAMTDQELGFYHRCLNRSWKNNGLPADLDELARVLQRSRVYVDKLWKRVGRKFVLAEDGLRLVNPRQEVERSSAILKSERATESVRTRYVRNTNDLPRAVARAESVCVSGSSLDLKVKAEEKSILRAQSEKPVSASGTHAFYVRWVQLTKRRTHESDTCSAWISVDAESEKVAVMACLERYGASAEVARGAVTNPHTWLYAQARDHWRAEWPAASSNGKGKSDLDLRRERAMANLARRVDDLA